MKAGLRTKLTFSYALVALMLIAVISICVNALFNIQFKNYVMNQQKQANQNIINLVEKQYDAKTQTWNISAVENIGMSALEQGMIVKVKDYSGGTVWDATVHNNGLCAQMLRQMAQNMKSQYPNFKGGYVQKSYTLMVGFKQIGEAEIGYYGPFYFTNSDISFLQKINMILALTGLVSLIMAILLGTYMSLRISRPVSKAVRAASEISKGNYEQRIDEKSNTREINDLTDSVNTLAQTLEKQENLRKQMASDVAHELRTPLANLQSSLEAMIDGVWEPNSERLTSCHEEILRINRMVGDLEKLERAEAETEALSLSDFDLSELVRHIIHSFETDYYKKGISLDFYGETAPVRADRDKISQVLVNLLSNALKYTPEGGSVRAQVKNLRTVAEITVADTGQGIPPEDLPNIFERFYRADKSRNRLTGGSGLGLTIAKATIEAHKGRISVSSELNKGTVFSVFLPKKHGQA